MFRKSALAKKDSFFSAFGKKTDTKKDAKESLPSTPSTHYADAELAPKLEPKKVEKKMPVKKAVIKNPEQERKRAAEESQIMNLFEEEKVVKLL